MKAFPLFVWWLLGASLGLSGEEATFFRALNLNGPALEIDDRPWEGQGSANLEVKGNAFENQAVPLKPVTDAARATMIRSSHWGSRVEVTVTHVPDGDYQLFLYVWEDNHSEQFDVLVNGRPVVEKAHSGSAGAWRRLGPWPATPRDGKLTVAGRTAGHGAVNFSGLEVWAGMGTIPEPKRPAFVTEPTPEQIEFFERRIRPVLAENCYECHSARAENLKGGLLLDSRAGLVKGGDTGPVVTPGEPDASLLILAVRHADPHLTMPPKAKLPPEVIADLEAWIRMGVPDPRTENTVAVAQARSAIDWDRAREWWSFRPLASPAPPEVRHPDWPDGDLDLFVLARLEAEGLPPAEDANKRTLIRRVTFDLIGLPPTPEEVDAFLADDSPEAFATVVDRLLASPHYGERWGRHWLDVVRYADTAGDNSDFPIPQMHRYRDWVIRAFNRDLPYDQFVREQLAGDLLPAATEAERRDRLIATGYIANARRFGSRVDDYPQHLTIEDTLDNLGRAFLGLTVGCARCHDHKFDPVTAADYYALYGIFHSTRYPWPGIELDQKQRDLVPLVAPDRLEEVTAARKARDEEQRRLEGEVKRLQESLKKAPETDKKTIETKIKQAEKAAAEHRDKPLPFEFAYAVAEGARVENVALQRKGDPAQPGDVIPRRFLTVLGGAAVPPESRSSGRRELAEWIVARDNPLTARVMVNRLWLHHFGKGLVPTANDFGKQGRPPTHPELLDWLASRFIDSGWSVKSMHRTILLSRTYRLSSRRRDEALARDPVNQWFGAFPRRRLDAEALRDTLLFLAGNLDTSPAGAHPFPPESQWKFTQHNPFRAIYDTNRRSIYLMTQRIQRHPYLAIFDGADPSTSTPVRTASTTPLQALFLLNDAFVHEQSKAFASRVLAAAPDGEARICFAYQAAFARPADADEIDRAQQFLAATRETLQAAGTTSERLETESWQAFARVLFRLNEFVYVD